MNSIQQQLEHTPVIPIIQSDDPAVAIQTTRALIAGGLSTIEFVLRTPEALSCMVAAASAVPAATVGVGTVLSASQAQEAIAAGARFIVSPGLHREVIDVAREHAVPVFPGAVTATEVQQAWNMGLRTLKFFPAEQSGGVAMIKTLSSVFGDVRFMPTGGISADNLASYLGIPAVLACGGSWLTPAAALEAGDFNAITKLAVRALSIAAASRG